MCRLVVARFSLIANGNSKLFLILLRVLKKAFNYSTGNQIKLIVVDWPPGAILMMGFAVRSTLMN